MKTIFLVLFFLMQYPSNAAALDICEILGKKKEIGEHLVEVREAIGLHDVYLCDDHKLYDTRVPKKLLTETLVDYGEIYFNPSKNIIAFLDYRLKGSYNKPAYRVMIYDMKVRVLKTGVESLNGQIYQVRWIDDTSLEYSYEHPRYTRMKTKKGWFKLKAD